MNFYFFLSLFVSVSAWAPRSSSLFPHVRQRMVMHASSPHINSISRHMKNLLGAAFITLATTSSVLADGVPLVGSAAPDFTLPSSLGKDISLADLKGKRTVLYFYPADFTSGCTIEAKNFERDYDEIKELGAEVIGVSVDSVNKHIDFSKDCKLEFPLLADQGGVLSDKFGSLLNLGFAKFSNRQTYIISPDLKIEYVFSDVDNGVMFHSKDVLKKLKELSG